MYYIGVDLGGTNIAVGIVVVFVFGEGLDIALGHQEFQTVFQRGHALEFLELVAEIVHVVIAQKFRDLTNAHFLFAEKTLTFFQTDVRDVFCGCHSKIVSKQNGKLRGTDIHSSGKIVNCELSINSFRHGLHSLVQDHAVSPF